MKPNTPFRFHLLWLAPFFFITLISGIGRDDVPIEQYTSRGRDSAYACVGELCIKGSFGSSCVLIHPKYVITTAHSVFMDSKQLVNDSIQTPLGMKPTRRAAYTFLPKPEQVSVKFGNLKIRGKRIMPHPLFDTSFRSLDEYDVAVIELETPVTNISIPQLYTGEMLNKRGIAVGWGEVSTADDYEGKKRHKRLKMAGENMIDSISPFLLWADMDHPRLSGFNRMGNEKPLPLEWMGSGGDSGSALFLEEENKLYLAGVSFSPAKFTDMYTYGKLRGVHYGFITGWANVSALHGWIVAQMQQ
jgi:hypothetical protein